MSRHPDSTPTEAESARPMVATDVTLVWESPPCQHWAARPKTIDGEARRLDLTSALPDRTKLND